MKLTVNTLDNKVKSAVINIGKNSGYVEAYLVKNSLVLHVYDKKGVVILQRFILID